MTRSKLYEKMEFNVQPLFILLPWHHCHSSEIFLKILDLFLNFPNTDLFWIFWTFCKQCFFKINSCPGSWNNDKTFWYYISVKFLECGAYLLLIFTYWLSDLCILGNSFLSTFVVLTRSSIYVYQLFFISHFLKCELDNYGDTFVLHKENFVAFIEPNILICVDYYINVNWYH